MTPTVTDRLLRLDEFILGPPSPVRRDNVPVRLATLALSLGIALLLLVLFILGSGLAGVLLLIGVGSNVVVRIGKRKT